jgi:hypothetical protein
VALVGEFEVVSQLRKGELGVDEGGARTLDPSSRHVARWADAVPLPERARQVGRVHAQLSGKLREPGRLAEARLEQIACAAHPIRSSRSSLHRRSAELAQHCEASPSITSGEASDPRMNSA